MTTTPNASTGWNRGLLYAGVAGATALTAYSLYRTYTKSSNNSQPAHAEDLRITNTAKENLVEKSQPAHPEEARVRSTTRLTLAKNDIPLSPDEENLLIQAELENKLTHSTQTPKFIPLLFDKDFVYKDEFYDLGFENIVAHMWISDELFLESVLIKYSSLPGKIKALAQTLPEGRDRDIAEEALSNITLKRYPGQIRLADADIGCLMELSPRVPETAALVRDCFLHILLTQAYNRSATQQLNS